MAKQILTKIEIVEIVPDKNALILDLRRVIETLESEKYYLTNLKESHYLRSLILTFQTKMEVED